MSTDQRFAGSMPEIYDSCLGPFLFSFAAKDMAARVAAQVREGGEVLEIAAGTGILTTALRRTLPESVEIVATDISEAMLAVAMEKEGLKDAPNVTFRAVDAMELPYEDVTFDAVVCQFGIMFFPDRMHCLSEMHRVLQPGGLVAVSVWDSLEHNGVVAAAKETISSFFEGEPPKFLDLPFGFYDRDVLTSLFTDAGFTDISFEEVVVEHTTQTAEDMARGLVAGNPGIVEVRERATADEETIVEAVRDTITNRFAQDSTTPQVSLQELTITATKQ